MQELPTKRKWGGAQPGAGRPKGKKNKATLERDAIRRRVEQRYLRAAEAIASAQLGLGVGSQYLMRIDKKWVKQGKGGYWRNERPVRVESLSEIEEYLEGAIKNGDAADDTDSGAAYYFLTTKDPENIAINSMFDRALGKVKENVEHSGVIGFSLLKLAQEAEHIEKLEYREKTALLEAQN